MLYPVYILSLGAYYFKQVCSSSWQSPILSVTISYQMNDMLLKIMPIGSQMVVK